MASEPVSYPYFRSATREALHLEMRDEYMPDDPECAEWLRGDRFDPAERWADWFDLMVETTGRGVSVRRARIVSEPLADSIRFEYEVTGIHNERAGEQVRWLPRPSTSGLLVPPSDFWVFDRQTIIWNHFSGDGNQVTEEIVEDAALAATVADSFEKVWKRAIPHQDYQPAP